LPHCHIFINREDREIVLDAEEAAKAAAPVTAQSKRRRADSYRISQHAGISVSVLKAGSANR
jgi:hypothetical protein